MNERWIADLVKASERVLTAFKRGGHPTFDQLSALEGALFPFINDKICGHRITEECDCLENGQVRLVAGADMLSEAKMRATGAAKRS